MDEHFKVCGNCGQVTMAGGEFICVDPSKPAQEAVPMGERRSCFVVTPLTPTQAIAAALSPDIPETLN